MNAPPHPLMFELRAEGLGALRVMKLSGRERLSKPYRFDVEVDLAGHALAAIEALLGRRVVISLAAAPGHERAVAGVVAHVALDESTRHGGHHRAILRVVPALALLARRRNTRIFQDQSFVEIVGAILGEHRVQHRWALDARPARRGYCVQYDETDLDFISRLSAEEGVFFHFEQPDFDSIVGSARFDDNVERVVFADAPAGYMPLRSGAAALPHRAVNGMSEPGEAVSELRRRRRLAPTLLTRTDYDFERPLLRLEARRGEVGATPAEVYVHQGEFLETEVAEGRAERQLQALRRRADRLEGRSNCVALAPGRRFAVTDAPEPSFEGEWTAVEVQHEGRWHDAAELGGRSYENRFRAVPASVVYRPRAPERRILQCLESATVVGPPDEAVHTDAFGRVKVQMHWDRDGRRDEHSSAWLRVAQAWAGGGVGTQFVPRIGSEVLVGFLNGDPDRPVIVGSLYNRVQPPPFPLPGEKMKSGLRTASRGGAGHSELSFDDASGHERVLLRAARDLELWTGGDQRSEVQGDAALRVAGSHRVETAGSETRAVRRHLATSVGGDASTVVDGLVDLQARGGLRVSADGPVHARAGALGVSIEGPAAIAAEGDLSLQSSGDLSITAGGPEAPKSIACFAFGGVSVSATDRIVLRADSGIELVCGEARLQITAETIEAIAKKIHAIADDEAFVAGAGHALELRDGAELRADTITLLSQGASLALDASTAQLGGSKVKLGQPKSASSSSSSSDDPETRSVSWTLLGEYGAPYRDKRWVMLVAGERFSGSTDGQGTLTATIPRAAKRAEVRVWSGDYPTGEQRRFDILIADALPDATTPDGARVRLHALGYEVGLHSDDPWGAMEGAVRSFQNRHADSHGLTASGELDDATLSAIREVHGA